MNILLFFFIIKLLGVYEEFLGILYIGFILLIESEVNARFLKCIRLSSSCLLLCHLAGLYCVSKK